MLRAAAMLSSLALLGLACMAACANKSAVDEPRLLMDQLVTDPTGRAQVRVSYRPQPPDMVELMLDVVGAGVDEMDKVAIDVKLDGLVLVEGTTQWAGFAPPRDHQKHRMLLRVTGESGYGTATVVMTRFHDSELLWQDEASFQATGETVVADD